MRETGRAIFRRIYLDRKMNPGVISRENAFECGDVVSLAAPPRDAAQVEPVVNTKVGEGHQVLLVDRIRRSRSSAAIRPSNDGEHRDRLCARWPSRPRSASGSRWHEEPVGRRRGMVELVDGHDVEVRRFDAADVGSVQTLNRCEHMLELPRRCRNPLLAERRIAQRVPERRAALVEDLLAVGHEQEGGLAGALAGGRA